MHSRKRILTKTRTSSLKLSQDAPGFVLALLVFVLALLAGASCGRARDPVPTGIVTEELGAGKWRITATAQAERGTIESGNPGSMQATSCDAARILLLQELKRPVYKNIRHNFKEGATELVYAGEYCRRIGIYDPEGKFELPVQREITQPPGR